MLRAHPCPGPIHPEEPWGGHPCPRPIYHEGQGGHPSPGPIHPECPWGPIHAESPFLARAHPSLEPIGPIRFKGPFIPRCNTCSRPTISGAHGVPSMARVHSFRASMEAHPCPGSIYAQGLSNPKTYEATYAQGQSMPRVYL